ncbi:MAG TPA: sulfatase-like hydrolase/transferase, partial [Polyangiaceae bacterium]|nr:sulfatase-like hydrolase/transferase [Polyangiaceae bacterium]
LDPRSFGARLASTLGGAALGAVVVTGIDAAYAAEGVPGPRMLLAELGLIAPLAVLLGVLSAVGAKLLLPPEFPLVGEKLRNLRARGATERREVSVRLIVAALGAVLALIVVTRIALRILAGDDTTLASGAVLSLAALGGAGITTLVATGAGVLVEDRFPSWSPDPVRVGVASLAGFVLAAILLIALGTTSGAGGTLAVFGVFRRQELDLRAVTLVLILMGSALAVPPVERRARAFLYAGAALVLALALFPYAAARGFERHVALSVERHAPLGKPLLAAVRRLSDRDHDGASAWFGGGDCAEGNPKIGPSADDVPGNGIDEDCSGSDALAVAVPAPAAALPAAESAFVHDSLPKRPNVMLVTIDATRADLGFLGYKRNVSPRLDELAKKSAVFENAYSLASYTSKSLAPMLIGHYGSETHRGWLHFNRFTREDVFVSERLQKAGIRTLSVQGHWYFFKNYGFERGYDVVDTRATPADQPIEGDRTSNGDALSDRIIAELERPELEQQQFFLWSHYIDAHAEYVPHKEFDFGHHGRELYDGELAFVDHHFGRVLDALAKRPFAERTIVIITSDHGEAFGEHGLYRHGFELWEELIRVPLVVYVPGATPRRISVRRGAIDIVPTILDIFGLPAPEAEKPPLHGVSLLPDVLAPTGYEAAPRIVYCDMPAGPYNDSREAYIEDDMKLITSGGRALGLFDLKNDPGEKHDLLDDAARARLFMAKTKAFRKTLTEVIERPK